MDVLFQKRSFRSDNHRADSKHRKNDIDRLSRLALRNQHVVDQRREDEGHKGDGQTSDKRNDLLEERADDGDHSHEDRHHNTKNHTRRVLHKPSFLRFR